MFLSHMDYTSFEAFDVAEFSRCIVMIVMLIDSCYHCMRA
jgi:hypothetical protein